MRRVAVRDTSRPKVGAPGSADRSLRRVRANALRSQVSSKFPPPLTKCGLTDVQPDPLLAHRFDDHVDVRMRLVRVQHHGIAVLGPKCLSRKDPGALK